MTLAVFRCQKKAALGKTSAKLIRILLVYLCSASAYTHSQVSRPTDTESRFKAASEMRLACTIAKSMATAYPNSSDFENRKLELQANLGQFSKRFSRVDWFEKSMKEQVPFLSPAYFQAAYHRSAGYEDFYLFAAFVRDTKTDFGSFLSRLYICTKGSADDEQVVEMLRRSKNGESLAEILSQCKIPEFYPSFYSGTPWEPAYFGLGPSANAFAEWLSIQNPSSITYEMLFTNALLFAKGDPLAALGMVSSVLSLDAMTNRKKFAFLNKKLIIPEKFGAIRGGPGFNYHFWGYVALAFVRPITFVRLRSFVYETLIQRDFEETMSDQSGATTGYLAQRYYRDHRLMQKYCAD